MKKPILPRGVSLLIIAILVIVIVLLTSLLLIPSDPPLTFNHYEFENINGLWRTTWARDGQSYNLDFPFTPDEVQDIPLEGEIDDRFNTATTYITIDPMAGASQNNSYMAVAAAELSRKLVTIFERNVVAACTRNETNACVDRPIVTCDSTNISVIHLKVDQETKIILDGNCVTFQGHGSDLVKAVDKAIYQWLGIL